MKIVQHCFIVLIAALCFSSCEKDFSAETGSAAGTLKDDGSGDCLPVTVNGTYTVGTPTASTNSVDVQVLFTVPGVYSIKSDLVNGYSFSGIGTVPEAGLATVHLVASGTPTSIGTGIDIFTISYGTSSCEVSVILAGGVPTSSFTLGGAGGSCTGATLSGTYTATVPTTAANQVTLNVNVTTVGSWSLSTSGNGVTFAGSGTFTTTGAQTVVLTATGTPATSGNVSYTVTAGSGSCSFVVNYAVPTPAAYTLSGAPGACTVATVAGTYGAGIALNSSNTVTVQVNVTAIGVYTISTNAVNGYSFTKTGAFTTTGIQTVVLAGTGTPVAAGTNSFTAGTGGCSFPVTVLGPAAYTFSGAPGACTTATVSGTYTAGTALGAGNTVVVQVNVTTIGSYTISTTAGGMTFSKTGSFTATGIQSVTLAGSGTPTTAGANTFTVGTGGCTFSITVAAGGTVIFHANINGTLTDFSNVANGTFMFSSSSTAKDDLFISGNGTSPVQFTIDIDRSGNGAVATGTYLNTLAAQTSGLYLLSVTYNDPAGAQWDPADIFSGTPDPFTVVISTLTATRVTGTFSGTIRSNSGNGTTTMPVTNGVFDLPIQ